MIKALNNEKIKYFKSLRDKKGILENKKYIVEGSHLVEEAYKSGLLEEIITCEPHNYNVKTTEVTYEILKKISLLKSAPKIMGIVKLKENNLIKGNKIVLLDNVQDPGNVGTIIRNALAFNVSTVVLSQDSVNIYNDKLIRSTEGAVFKVNVITINLTDAIKQIREKNIKVYYADMYGENELDNLNLSEYALIMGSEGQGVSETIKNLCDSSIKIPINSNCESLNVGVSSGIIMYKFR